MTDRAFGIDARVLEPGKFVEPNAVVRMQVGCSGGEIGECADDSHVGSL